MTILGSKLTALAALSGTIASSDLLYVVRAGSQYKASASQIRVASTQISDGTTLGKALLTAATAGDARTLLELGGLAGEDTVGTSEIDNAAVTLDKMANLAEDHVLLGDGSNRPAPFLTTDLGQALLAIADIEAAQVALFDGPALDPAATGEVRISDGMVDVGDALLYRGVQVVGAPAAPIANATNDPDDLRDTLNALLDALRDGTGHGLLAVGS